MDTFWLIKSLILTIHRCKIIQFGIGFACLFLLLSESSAYILSNRVWVKTHRRFYAISQERVGVQIIMTYLFKEDNSGYCMEPSIKSRLQELQFLFNLCKGPLRLMRLVRVRVFFLNHFI